MNPDERQLLERTLRLSEENNQLLRKINRRARWSFLWGIAKIAIIVVPLVAGYLFLEPYLNEAVDNYAGIKDTLNQLSK